MRRTVRALLVSSVLDASALLAVVFQEAGRERVNDAIDDGAVILAVNLAEVVSTMSNGGMSEARIRAILGTLNPTVVPFDEDLAYRAGLLRPATRSAGLSLGDRACLALAGRLGLPALTTDRVWARVQVGVQIDVVR
jgi:ribonuclease VapC